MEGRRNFLCEGEQDPEPERREYDSEARDQQEWERCNPYNPLVELDDDETLPGDEPFNKVDR